MEMRFHGKNLMPDHPALAELRGNELILFRSFAFQAPLIIALVLFPNAFVFTAQTIPQPFEAGTEPRLTRQGFSLSQRRNRSDAHGKKHHIRSA